MVETPQVVASLTAADSIEARITEVDALTPEQRAAYLEGKTLLVAPLKKHPHHEVLQRAATNAARYAFVHDARELRIVHELREARRRHKTLDSRG